ncbi:hypothetical protein D1BOALGB6SA_4901 [Olavius sp. associated proteobacterium Delta 1]|nr:hypothetical protein D1BOALGB6SA_4901 [Olavius sp. associated proteobacterium Delta 1]
MNLLAKRIQKIKQSLRDDNLEQAASLLVNTIASDEIFSYWASCCNGSEQIPKILKFIRHIAFNRRISTAVINFMEGDLRIGTEFFLQHILGPEDLLFILVHERDHLILRNLYPSAISEDYPAELLNFGEDAYINAIARRYIPSTLPERFYQKPQELLLTGRHRTIDWDYFNVKEDGLNMLQQVHANLYRQNHELLKVIGEHIVSRAPGSGYGKWMDLILRWYQSMQSRPKASKHLGKGTLSSNGAESNDMESQGSAESEAQNNQVDSPEHGDQAVEEEKQASSEDPDHRTEKDALEVSENKTGEDQVAPDEQKAEGERPCSDQDNPKKAQRGRSKADGAADPNDQSGTAASIDEIMGSIVPLVRQENFERPLSGPKGRSSHGRNGLLKVPLPRLKPHDQITWLIQQTCDDPKIRQRVSIFEGDALEHVDGLINGILSDRSIEKVCDGYSLSVPLSISRRDAFTLSAGAVPVMWQKRMGVERPNIDVYIDVSGSMERFYGYIPYIYDSLKHVMNRIFQFSTQVVQVEHDDQFLLTNGGTCFNSVAQHMVEHQIRAAILLSDGQSHLTNENIESLKCELEHLIYIKVQENDYKNWELIATETICLLSEKGVA